LPIKFSLAPAGWPDFQWVECTRCGTYKLHPNPTQEQLRAAYNAGYYGATRKKFSAGAAALIEVVQRLRARWISQWVPRPGRILEVGCGNGNLLRFLQRLGYDVEGTEWSAESAHRIPPEWNIPVQVGDLADLPLPENQYAAVILWHVLEHLPRPQLALAKIHRLLKQDGVVLLAVPNHDSRQSHRFGAHWFHLDPPRHLHGFRLASLRRLLAVTGYQIIRSGTFSADQGVYGFIQSQLNAWEFPRDRAYAVLKRTSQVQFGKRLLDLALIGLLFPWGVGYNLMETLTGHGPVCTLVARRNTTTFKP
jgi:SAM-dependent methyltransferase